MSERRSSRLRRKPTPIYQVEDKRASDDEADAEAEQQHALVDDEQGGDSSEEGPEGEDEEFTPSGTKVKKPKSARKALQTPQAKARAGRRKRSPWSQTRNLRSAGEARKSKRNASTTETEEGAALATAPAAGDNELEDDGDSLFEAIKSGKASLENLLSEWRDRYEEDDEKATKEVLNLVLQACGGTGQCVPESEPLAQLDMSALADHVLEDLENANGEYPLTSRGKGMKKFQRNFEEFLEVFVKECYESEILFTSDIANNFIDWLTTLSSSELRPIRHTSTVAIFALSNSLVRTAASISEQLAISTRQLNAETNSPGTTSGAHKSPNNQKIALLKDNKTLYETRFQQVLELVNLIFTGVVVHRYRDVMPDIRVVSIQCLGYWIITLPDQFLKDNFLKYLGWLLSDKSASVRVEVVEILCELYENDAFTEKLELFTSRFLPRYLELCNDVDDAVVEESIHLLIAVDKRSLISSDIELQPVEKLVFDAAHEDIRKAAAEFVCLQYDAFGVAVSKTKDAKLKKDQLNTQVIALVEFAEEYIKNHGIPEAAVVTLVDAFWGLDDCLVLQDWRLLTNLLLVDKSAPDLSSEQQTILLRLLVASINKLVGNDINRGASAATKKESEQLREDITVAYCKDIPNLFLLYQADSDKLELLLQLIPMLSLKSEIQQVCRTRSTLEEALISVLEMHLARSKEDSEEEHKDNEETPDAQSVESMEEIEFDDEDVVCYVKEAQRFAFLTFCDVRCLFVEKFHDATAPFEALEWSLPKVLVLLTQMHFESEMDDAEEEEPEFEDDMVEVDPAVAKEKADAIREWKEKQQRKAELLVALGRVSLCNPSKKHQAAAVLQYFTSSGKQSVEVVKAFGKQVKSDAPVRYLEIQMTALRQMFTSILIWKQDLESAVSSESNKDEVSEQDELREKVESSEQELRELAKRFSQSLGVGKIPSSLRAPFLRFMREGVRYSLEHPTQFEFLETMRVYVSRLDNSSTGQLREYFMERFRALSDIPDDSEDLGPQWRAVFDFQASLITNGTANGKRHASTDVMFSPLKSKRRSASSEPTPMQGTSIAEEDEEENEESDHGAAVEEDADGRKAGNREQVDHNSRQGSPRLKRAVADDNSSTTDSVPLRKRPRRQQRRTEDAESSDNEQVADQKHSKRSSAHQQDKTKGEESDQEVQNSGAESEHTDTQPKRRKRRRA
ncbi:putative cohesin subunit [Phytophthora cinnamomi]|uniref:putative cohesin subunit n=1 Tax=Phytophthora cinnamomi TaxID=4785 RepID=UPI00355A8A97|nr:putative cohesin subunit [Phytophthora cinnamomi]